jgi:rhodanese-related sulfurtransferase
VTTKDTAMPMKKTLTDLADAIRPTVDELDTDQLFDMHQNDRTADRPEAGKAILIDVREPDERNAGYIPNSAFLPRGILERDIEQKLFDGNATEQDLDRHIICYCRGGHRSIMTAHNLKQMGFTKVSSLAGGYRAWKESGKPVETP